MKTKTINDYRYKYKELPSGCWEWQGYLNRGGYGNQIVGSRADGSRKQVLAHRLFYELRNGKISDGLCVLHKCDNPKCVNPEHLFIGTRADNHEDMLKKGRRVDLRGEARPNSKLQNHQVMNIKIQLIWGVNQKDIAKQYGVNQTLISAIKTGKVWGHVNPEYYTKTMAERGYDENVKLLNKESENG